MVFLYECLLDTRSMSTQESKSWYPLGPELICRLAAGIRHERCARGAQPQHLRRRFNSIHGMAAEVSPPSFFLAFHGLSLTFQMTFKETLS